MQPIAALVRPPDVSTSRNTPRTDLSRLTIRALAASIVAALVLVTVTALLPDPHTDQRLDPSGPSGPPVGPVTISNGTDVTVVSQR